MHYFAAPVHAAVLQGLGPENAQVRHQGAAERHVEHLMAAADAQQRLALAEGFVNQNELAQVPGTSVPHGNAVMKPGPSESTAVRFTTAAATSAGIPGERWIGIVTT